MRTPLACGKNLLAGVTGLAVLAFLGTAHAGVTVLYAFKGGSDGAGPAGLIEDSAHNLYGTTGYGGGTGCGGQGCGTVFRLAADGTETVLYAFHGHKDGQNPSSGVIEDEAGNLYGSTTSGGDTHGNGTVFKLAPDGTEKVVHRFGGGSDGSGPKGLIEDGAGNLYGTTYDGGGTGCEMGYGCGIVFRLAPDGKETVLYSFGRYDGHHPEAGLIRDKAGNLYGTTAAGGGGGDCSYYGCGTVFKLAPDGTETVLYDFTHKHRGLWPTAAVMKDKSGNLYGTTSLGGSCQADGCGTVFKLAPDGTETVLHAFHGRKHDGAFPEADLIEDQAGNLYGTTTGGGGGSGCTSSDGCGTVFKLAPDGTETVLYAFRNHTRRGREPSAGLIKGGDGILYGTANDGGIGCNGRGCGTVFRLDK